VSVFPCFRVSGYPTETLTGAYCAMVPLAIEAAQVKAIGEVKTTSLGAGWLCRGVEQPSDRVCASMAIRRWRESIDRDWKVSHRGLEAT
jgi:hypothetical protein